MVKGCQRRVLHLKNPESGLFEEAFFFLKSPPVPGAGGARELVEEANRILLGFRTGEPRRCPRFFGSAFLIGALSGACFATALLFVIGLIV